MKPIDEMSVEELWDIIDSQGIEIHTQESEAYGNDCPRGGCE